MGWSSIAHPAWVRRVGGFFHTSGCTLGCSSAVLGFGSKPWTATAWFACPPPFPGSPRSSTPGPPVTAPQPQPQLPGPVPSRSPGVCCHLLGKPLPARPTPPHPARRPLPRGSRWGAGWGWFFWGGLLCFPAAGGDSSANSRLGRGTGNCGGATVSKASRLRRVCLFFLYSPSPLFSFLPLPSLFFSPPPRIFVFLPPLFSFLTSFFSFLLSPSPPLFSLIFFFSFFPSQWIGRASAQLKAESPWQEWGGETERASHREVPPAPASSD